MPVFQRLQRTIHLKEPQIDVITVSEKTKQIKLHPQTLENVKGEFESFGELPSVRETGIQMEIHR